MSTFWETISPEESQAGEGAAFAAVAQRPSPVAQMYQAMRDQLDAHDALMDSIANPPRPYAAAGDALMAQYGAGLDQADRHPGGLPGALVDTAEAAPHQQPTPSAADYEQRGEQAPDTSGLMRGVIGQYRGPQLGPAPTTQEPTLRPAGPADIASGAASERAASLGLPLPVQRFLGGLAGHTERGNQQEEQGLQSLGTTPEEARRIREEASALAMGAESAGPGMEQFAANIAGRAEQAAPEIVAAVEHAAAPASGRFARWATSLQPASRAPALPMGHAIPPAVENVVAEAPATVGAVRAAQAVTSGERAGSSARTAAGASGALATLLPAVTDDTGRLLSRAERTVTQLGLPGLQDTIAAAPAAAQGAVKAALSRANGLVGTYGRLNLLVSPLTHLGNVAGTAAAMPWQFAERLTAPLVEPLWRRAGKPPEPRYAGEAFAQARGWWSALHAAAANVVDVLAHGDAPLTAAITGEAARPAAGAVERTLALGYRPLAAEDAFFKTMAEGGELQTLAYRAARQAGLHGQALDEAVLHLTQSPTPEMIARVARAGEYETYTSVMDQAGKALQTVAETLPGAQFVLPFYKQPYNALKYDLERSPAGVVGIVRGALDPAVTSGEMADRTVRMLLGSAIAAGLYTYARAGNLTGALPDSQGERDAWEAEGKTPWSIKLGDSWWQINKVPGLGATLGMAGGLADAARQMQQPNAQWQQVASRFALTMADVLAQKPLLDNLAGLLGAINDPGHAQGFLRRLGATVEAQALPASSLGRYVNNLADPVRRAPQNALQQAEVRYPGLAGNVPVRRDAFGRPEPRTQTGVEAAVNPFGRSAMQPGVRRYVGSSGAAQDEAIADAIRAVRRYQADSRGNPRPTSNQRSLYAVFSARGENPVYTRLRQAELERQRRAAIMAGGLGR